MNGTAGSIDVTRPGQIKKQLSALNIWTDKRKNRLIPLVDIKIIFIFRVLVTMKYASWKIISNQ